METPQTVPASFVKPRISSIKPLSGTGNLKAFASVEFSFGLTIHEIRVIQQPGQKAWVGAPCREWTDPSGKKRFAPVLEIDRVLKAEIDRVVLEAYESAMAGEGVEHA